MDNEYNVKFDRAYLMQVPKTTSVRANQEQVVGEHNVGSASIFSQPRPTRGRAATTRATRPRPATSLKSVLYGRLFDMGGASLLH